MAQLALTFPAAMRAAEESCAPRAGVEEAKGAQRFLAQLSGGEEWVLFAGHDWRVLRTAVTMVLGNEAVVILARRSTLLSFLGWLRALFGPQAKRFEFPGLTMSARHMLRKGIH